MMTMKYGKGKWAIAGSKVDGAVHIRQERPCQDAILTREFADFAIAAVADGHGSASCPFSEDGANAAVDIAAELLEAMIPVPDSLHAHKDIRLPKMLEAKWKEAVEKIHAEQGRELTPGEPFPHILYGTTLVAIAAAKDFVFALQIGDGNILMVDRDGNARPILEVADTVGEETESLCLDEAWTYVRTQIIPWTTKDAPTMFLISTDGYAKSFADSSGFIKAGTDFFNIWREDGLSYISENLEDWLRKSSDKGSGDDIAMALLAFEGD
jgi:hypothetical protein